jgi:prephenate dehydrogenase
MKIAVIGAAGKMGYWFTKFFLEQGDSLIVAGRTKKKLLKLKDEFDVEVADNVTAVRNADRVLISVPIENFEEVVKEIHLYVKPNQVIMDICSIKEFPVAVMHKYIKKGMTLGIHPMFGPTTREIRNKNFILTPTNAREMQFANDFKIWLEKRKAKVSIMSPRKHDELMTVVLGLSHFVGMVACDTLLSEGDFAEMKKVTGPSFKLLSELAERVASQDPDFYASLQTNLPNIYEIESLFYQKAGEWLDIVKKKDQTLLADKMKSIKTKLEKIDTRRK